MLLTQINMEFLSFGYFNAEMIKEFNKCNSYFIIWNAAVFPAAQMQRSSLSLFVLWLQDDPEVRIDADLTADILICVTSMLPFQFQTASPSSRLRLEAAGSSARRL
jgi:hypothetical protein